MQRFTGDVTMNAGGVWNETGIAAFSIAGNFTNNGTTFTASTGVHTFSGGAKTLSGSTAIVIPSAAFTGDYTNSGTLTCATALSGAGQITNDATGTLNVGGTSAITALVAGAVGNTVNYTGAAQIVHNNDYHHLALSGSGAKTLQAGTATIGGNLTLSGTATTTTVAALMVSGNLSVGNGTTFTAAGFALTVTGTTTVGAGASGMLTISSAAGAKQFVGLVSVSAGGTWNNSGNSPIELQGGLTNDATGTFTAGTGAYTFTTNAQALNGTFSIPSITVTTITLTNNGTLTVGTALTGTGGLTNAGTGTLNLGGSSAITTLTANAGGNTVNFNGTGAQTVKGVTYSNLTINKATGTATLGGAVTATAFTMTAGTLDPGSFLLTATTSSTLTAGTLKVGATTWGGNYSFAPTIPSGFTVDYYNGSQAIETYTYYDLILSGSGTKTFAASTTISNNLSITGTAIADLGPNPNSQTSSALTLGGTGQVAGTWGGTGSGATNINTTYFAPNSGQLTVGSSSISATWTGATNTVWATATNWSSGSVPDASTNVSIPSTANQPTIGANAVCNNLGILSGATLTVGGFTLTVSGATTVAGTLTLSSATGTKTFTGAVTISSGGTLTENSFAATLAFGSDVVINSGGTLTESGAAVVGVAGSLTNNGTYTASTGVHTFSGTTQTISGTNAISIPSVTASGTYTNNGTLTVGTALAGAGALTQGATGILNLGGTSIITTLTATASGNTVNYTGAAQTVHVNTDWTLTVSGSAAK
ncbi:MAG: hypothetical protein NTU47_08200, partial [Ignavibacteriales bacterium]|nr:hypothetical protein [Ignavibacteriales bacterium]